MSNAAESLARVSDMADALTAAQGAVDRAVAALDAAKAALRTIEEEDFPSLMQELELKEVKLTDGRKIVLEHALQCGITEANKPGAHGWLRGHGFGGIIKTELRVPFSRGEEEAMSEAEKKIYEATGRAPERFEGVHPQTLKSFLKEQRERAAESPDGANPPEELFGIRPFDRVRVKAAK